MFHYLFIIRIFTKYDKLWIKTRKKWDIGPESIVGVSYSKPYIAIQNDNKIHSFTTSAVEHDFELTLK